MLICKHLPFTIFLYHPSLSGSSRYSRLKLFFISYGVVWCRRVLIEPEALQQMMKACCVFAWLCLDWARVHHASLTITNVGFDNILFYHHDRLQQLDDC